MLRNGVLDMRHWQVYHYLFHYGPITPNETHAKIEELEGPTNKPSITPRFARLERMGLIIDLGLRVCSVSKKECHFYDVTSKTATKTDFLNSKLPSREELQKELKKLRLENEELKQLAKDIYAAWTDNNPEKLKPNRFEIQTGTNPGLTYANEKLARSAIESYCELFRVPLLTVKIRPLIDASVVKRELDASVFNTKVGC